MKRMSGRRIEQWRGSSLGEWSNGEDVGWENGGIERMSDGRMEECRGCWVGEWSNGEDVGGRMEQ